MSRQVGDAAYSVALHLYIGAQHLPDQGFQSSQLHNEELVVGYWGKGKGPRPSVSSSTSLSGQLLPRIACEMTHD